MNLTNKLNLPAAIVKAVSNDNYDRPNIENYFSCTELLTPPRQRALKKRHAHEIVEDASDRIWSLLGQAAHVICERGNVNDLAEKRFLGKFGIYTVGAQIDSLGVENGQLRDYKITTAYAFKANQSPKPEWVAQLNIQAEILRMNGHEVKSLQIIGILRDWSKLEALKDPNYPQFQVAIQPIETWSREHVQSFINERIALHVEAETSLPECSSEDRWAKPDVYAVMKGARAIPGGLQYSLEAANKMKADNPGSRVEFRPGINNRCLAYCVVADKCQQYQALLAKKTEVKSEVS